MKKLIFLLSIISLVGCGAAIRHLDATLEDDQTQYAKSVPLPPLAVPPKLLGNP